MKIFGYWLTAAGIIYLIVAFNMNVSINVPTIDVPDYGSVGGGTVTNLDLMARRQNHILVAALITLIGALMAIFDNFGVTMASAKSQPVLVNFQGERDLSSDEYCLWLAKHYRIERNEVFDRFVTNEQTFGTLDDALAHAHSLEQQKIAAAVREAVRIEEEDAAKKETLRINTEEAEAQWQRNRPKFIVATIIAIGLSLAAYIVLRESPEELKARLALQEAERVEEVKKIEQKFGVLLPKDVLQVGVTENAANFDYLCNDKKNGTLLQFRTGLTEQEVQKMFAKKLGRGESEYGSLADNFDWNWKRGNLNYRLSMPSDRPPTDVQFCITKQ